MRLVTPIRLPISAALVLGKLKRDAEETLGSPVESCVLTCPANSQDDFREKLLMAAEMVGLKASKLIPEPTSAALAYGLQHGIDQTVCVYDLGGGTYDNSVVDCISNRIDVLGTSGDPKLGGRDFDRGLSKFTVDEFEQQAGFRPNRKDDPAFDVDVWERTEQAKFALFARDKTTITLGARGQYATIEVTREKFKQLTEGLVRQTVDTCNDLLSLIGKQWSDIDKLLLVGGGSKAPGVKEAIEQASGLSASQDIDPLLAVSYGAAIQAAVEAGGMVVDGRAIPAPNLKLQDVTAYAVGCTIDDMQRGMSACAVVLPRHSAVPSSHTKVFRLKFPDQTEAEIILLQGNDGEPADRCLELGRVTLKGLPADPTLPLRIEVSVDIDGNGMISARGTDKTSGKSVEMKIDYSRGISKGHAA